MIRLLVPPPCDTALSTGTHTGLQPGPMHMHTFLPLTIPHILGPITPEIKCEYDIGSTNGRAGQQVAPDFFGVVGEMSPHVTSSKEGENLITP